jgi:hypothetical protein
MTPSGDGFADLTCSVRFEDLDGGVMHEHDHRGRAARAGEALDDFGGFAQAKAGAADVRGAQEPEQALSSECVDIAARENSIAVDFAGRRRNGVGDSTFESVPK